jgi:hypothetical protein
MDGAVRNGIWFLKIKKKVIIKRNKFENKQNDLASHFCQPLSVFHFSIRSAFALFVFSKKLNSFLLYFRLRH